MSGTTSMALSHFALAKLAALPIMLLYVFIGASAGALVAASSRDSGHLEENAQKLEENPSLILFGIVISVVMISTISVYIKKELFKVRHCVLPFVMVEP
jgi:ABC-type proline/glycine betaine transport system permease subunit